MAHIPWTLYAMRLQRVAQRMAEARNDTDVARCLQEHSALWERISGLISEAEGDGVRGLRRQMSPLTRLVTPRRGSGMAADDLSAEAVSSLIALNRQAAALLPDLELGTPVRQWLN